jgi:hypothetical protein
LIRSESMRVLIPLFAVLLVAFTVGACAPEGDTMEPSTGEEAGGPLIPEPDIDVPETSVGDVFEPEVEAALSGELRSVDVEAMTFVVLTEGGVEEEFEFTEETEVVGAAGTQALAGEQGSRITVYYDEAIVGTPEAVRIEIDTL